MVNAATTIEGVDCGGIYLVNPESGALDLIYSKGLSPDFVKQVSHYEKDNPRVILIMQAKPVFTEYPKFDESEPDFQNIDGLQALAIIPIFHHGQVIACMNMASHTVKDISSFARNALEAIASQASSAIGRLRAKKELSRHRDHLEELVKERTAELEIVNRELNDFAYIVSHDLKAPLRAITQLSGFLLRDYNKVLDEKGQEFLALLGSRGKRMRRLLDDILEYSKLGRVQEKKRETNINDLVRDAIELSAPPDNIQITIENELPVIFCEKTRILQIFQNLVSNAINFMDKPVGEIKIKYASGDTHHKFVVSDNGPGIEEKYHKKIFEIFQTLSIDSEHNNTGIGLSIVKRIVELNGGVLWLESDIGKGTTFFFTIQKGKPDGKQKTDSLC